MYVILMQKQSRIEGGNKSNGCEFHLAARLQSASGICRTQGRYIIVALGKKITVDARGVITEYSVAPEEGEEWKEGATLKKKKNFCQRNVKVAAPVLFSCRCLQAQLPSA